MPYLGAPLLEPGVDEAYFLPGLAGESGSLFDHCLRAIDRSQLVGGHGLPLMGSGDWNDGMNRVGREGRGESTWLGFFLHGILGDFASLSAERGDEPRAERYRAQAARLANALELAWDGEWYRRGYYDDGSPLGSAARDECRIDSLPQSWAVLSAGRSAAFRRPRARCGASASRPARDLAGAAAPAAVRPCRARTPATSAAIRPECARTAGSTPMPPSGS